MLKNILLGPSLRGQNIRGPQKLYLQKKIILESLIFDLFYVTFELNNQIPFIWVKEKMYLLFQLFGNQSNARKRM